jgi:hypothetical protein
MLKILKLLRISTFRASSFIRCLKNMKRRSPSKEKEPRKQGIIKPRLKENKE